MQEYNSIHKIEVTPNELVTIKKATIITPADKLHKDVTFCIQTVDDLTTLFTKITQLFHHNYFRLNGSPLIVFQTISLERLFNEKIQKLGLGNFTLINLETNNEFVLKQPTPIQFNEWINEGTITSEFYFVSKDLILFNAWKKTLSQHQIHQVFNTFTSHQLLLELKRKKENLIVENHLLSQSLNAIKTEYSKELNWYKNEVKNINKWYQNRYTHIPDWLVKLAYVFKFFKKK